MVSQYRAAASEYKHQPHPSIPKRPSPTPRRLPELSRPSTSPPECRRPEIHTARAAPALPIPPARAIQDRPPHPLYSGIPPSPAPPPGGPTRYARASAALVHLSPPPPESPHPSARRP